MPYRLHHRLPSRELATARRTLSGRVDAAALAPRLAEALARERPVGTVSYELSFAPAPQGGVAVNGRIHARLEATCQRCLEPFMVELDVPVEVFLDELEHTGNRADTSEAGETATLAGLIEEELLLALPFLPRHVPGACTLEGTAPATQNRPDTQRPFAGLQAALASRDRKHRS